MGVDEEGRRGFPALNKAGEGCGLGGFFDLHIGPEETM